MARPKKQTVGYFPHYTADSTTVRRLKSRWRNDGYAFWYQLLELLCKKDGQTLDVSDNDEWEDLLEYTDVDSGSATEILNFLAKRGNIDAELWNIDKVIWCPNLVENLTPLYDKRVSSAPQKPALKPPGKDTEDDSSQYDKANPPRNDTNPTRNDGNPSRNDNIPPLNVDIPPVEYIREEETGLEDIKTFPHPGDGDSREQPSAPRDDAGESLADESAASPESPSKTRQRRKSSLNSQKQESFARFWELYPKKVSKGDAEKAWKRINPDDDLLLKILGGVTNAKRYDSRFRDAQFIPYPASWLNSKGWENDFSSDVTQGYSQPQGMTGIEALRRHLMEQKKNEDGDIIDP